MQYNADMPALTFCLTGLPIHATLPILCDETAGHDLTAYCLSCQWCRLQSDLPNVSGQDPSHDGGQTSFLYRGAATYSKAVKQLGYHLESLRAAEQNACAGQCQT